MSNWVRPEDAPLRSGADRDPTGAGFAGSTDQEHMVAGRHTDTAPDGLVDDVFAVVDSTDVDLASDPFDDDLSEQLSSRTPLRVTRTTVGLAAAVLVVAGFLGGVLVQKNFGATTPTAATGLPTGLAGRFGAGTGVGAGAQGGGTGAGQGGGTGTTGAGPGGTSGTVKLVDGTTVYITTAAGDVVIVKTSATTAIRSEQTVALKDLKVGATVTVVGTTASDGSINATQVTAAR